MRSPRIALALVVVSVFVLALVIRRRGYSTPIAIACATIAAFMPGTWTRLSASADAAMATLMVVAAIASALHARRAPMRTSVVATLLMVFAVTVAPLAALIALLSAAGALLLATIAGRLPRPRAAAATLLSVIAIVLVFDQINAPPADTWRLRAWRDAVEATLPEGSLISTTERAIATLHGRLFRGRSAAIQIIYRPTDHSTSYQLDGSSSSPEGDAATRQLVVPKLAGVDQFIAHAPDRTIVGVAASSRVANAQPAALVQTLRRIGRSNPGTVAFSTFGVVKSEGALQDFAPSKALLIGEVIAGSQQRSPTDVELFALDDSVRVRVRGRDLVLGAAWAVILLSPRGPVMDVFSGPNAALAVPAYVRGLTLWRRVPESGSRP